MRHYDQQVVETEENRRSRLHDTVFFGHERQRRQSPRTLKPLVIGVFLAALIAAGCVATSFVANLLEEQAQRREDQTRSVASMSIAHHPGGTSWPWP